MSVRIHAYAHRFRITREKERESREALGEGTTLEAAFDEVAWKVERTTKEVTGLVPAATLSPSLEDLLETLAPYVERGSFVVVDTDVEGTRSWIFDGESCASPAQMDEDELEEILGAAGVELLKKGATQKIRQSSRGKERELAAATLAIRCSHPKFGPGTIVRIEGDKAEVMFETGGGRKLLRTFLTEA